MVLMIEYHIYIRYSSWILQSIYSPYNTIYIYLYIIIVISSFRISRNLPHHRPSIVQLLSCLVGLTLGAQQGLADVYGTPATPGAAVNVNETPGKRPQVLGKMLGECWENRKNHGKCHGNS